LDLAELSNPAVKYRLDKSVDFLHAIVGRLLADKSASPALHWPGRSIRIADSTSLSRPGSTGTDWRVHGVFDLGTGGFSNLEITDGHGAESLGRGAPVPGEVRIADRGYSHAKAWQRFLAAGQGTTDLIVRLKWKSFVFSTPDGARFDLVDHLATLPDDLVPHEITVRAQVSRGVFIPMRLIILRKPPEATQATCKALRAQASRKQHRLDPRTLLAAGFVILGTSLPADGYPAGEVLAAYRLRWQIKLAFKRLKSLLHIDKLPTRTECATLSWLYAHLILALLCDDLSQDVLESFPSGPARCAVSAIPVDHPEGRAAGPARCRSRALHHRTARQRIEGLPSRPRQRQAKAQASGPIHENIAILAPMGLRPKPRQGPSPWTSFIGRSSVLVPRTPPSRETRATDLAGSRGSAPGLPALIHRCG